MKRNRIGLAIGLTAFLVLGSSTRAMATIETIKGTLRCFLGCDRGVVQLVAQGEHHAFEVVGQFVDTSTAVEITGAGVAVSYGTRKHGANSSIIVKLDVRADAAPGERTVRMRYAVEVSGPDTFRVRVVNKGSITRIQYRRPLPPQAGGGPATELVPPTDLPLGQRLVLLVTGTRLRNAEVRPESAYRSVRILPGATESTCEVEIEFTAPGQNALSFFDSALTEQDMRASGSAKFSYDGATTRNVQYGGGPRPGLTTVLPPIRSGAGGGGAGLFVDVAPRANMVNVFRRSSPNPTFTRDGVQYFGVDSEHCNGVPLGQSRVVTVREPIWGVSNVGTAATATPFPAELRSGTAILSTQTITALNPGQTRDFTFVRPASSVRVFTFLDRGGCFVSPTADRFFEDPPFTVVVNDNNALTEAGAGAGQANNRRNY